MEAFGSSFVVIAIAMSFCGNTLEAVGADGQCAPGVKPIEYKLELFALDNQPIGSQMVLPDTTRELTAIARLKREDRIVFSIKPDGSVEGKNPNDAARRFWKMMAHYVQQPPSALCQGLMKEPPLRPRAR